MSKTAENFESKLVEWGLLLCAYETAMTEAKLKNWSKANERELERIGKQMDKLRGPLMTALNKYAKEIV